MEEDLAAMAADPDIQREIKAIDEAPVGFPPCTPSTNACSAPAATS